MPNLSLIQENYERLPTEDLLRIAADPTTLDPEVIPVLQKELIARNQPEQALALTDYLVNGRARLSFMTLEDLQRHIFERLDSGESIESINIDLKENGIDILDVLNAETTARERVFDYMLSLKEIGLDESEVKKNMQDTFSIDEGTTELIHAQFKRKGLQNLIIGFSLITIVGFLFGFGGINPVLAALGAAMGIWMIVLGFRQLR